MRLSARHLPVLAALALWAGLGLWREHTRSALADVGVDPDSPHRAPAVEPPAPTYSGGVERLQYVPEPKRKALVVVRPAWVVRLWTLAVGSSGWAFHGAFAFAAAALLVAGAGRRR